MLLATSEGWAVAHELSKVGFGARRKRAWRSNELERERKGVGALQLKGGPPDLRFEPERDEGSGRGREELEEPQMQVGWEAGVDWVGRVCRRKVGRAAPSRSPAKSSSSALTGEIESEVLVGGSSVEGALLVRRSREEGEG